MDDVIYVGIGNSDDKLTQREWAEFQDRTLAMCEHYGTSIGAWYSSPISQWQNACFCVGQVKKPESLRKALGQLAGTFRQDSISFAEAATVFVKPPGVQYR